MKDIRLVVVSGPSGSGKSTAIKALEDVGFFCVDNLPVSLLPKFLEVLSQSTEISKVAAVMDVREGEFLKGFVPVFAEIKDAGYRAEVLYLEATDDALVRRFSETRRRHPLADSESPQEGISRERELLSDLKEHANKIVDTTSFNVHQLRDAIKEYYSGPVSERSLSVNLVSFGFRYGIPNDADMVMDVRFLPNPYFVDDLKRQDGRDPGVIDFVLGKPETKKFIGKFEKLLSYLLPLYWKEGKSYLTIAIGCTGGRHRSVVIAEKIAKELDSENTVVKCKHRDIQRP